MSQIAEQRVSVLADRLYREWTKEPLGTDPFHRVLERAIYAGMELAPRPTPLKRGGLTKSQRALLNYLSAYMQEHNYGPSFDEMKDAMGLKSKSGIHRMIVALEERGFINRLPHRARALEIIAA